MPLTASDERWMRAAIEIGKRGLGRVWPNPAVGCVIVRDGRLLGRGWTQPGGRPHAETMALGQAGDAAQGATAYVSLEPCAHHGRTPPCANALIAAGVARVVAPMVDPDPRVAGKGFSTLRQAGVHVDIGCLSTEAEAANEGFLTRQHSGRPFVTLKLASTLDGRIAMASGESRWITGPAARERVHLMRATHDAIMVGAGTARADDPMLDVRLAGMDDRSPVVVIADPSLSVQGGSRLASSGRTIWRLHDPALESPSWGDGIPVDRREDGHLDMSCALSALATKGVTRLFCEGGGALAASLLRLDLVDELIWMSAGAVIGASGVPAVGDTGTETLAAISRYRLHRTEILGPDMVSYWRKQPCQSS